MTLTVTDLCCGAGGSSHIQPDRKAQPRGQAYLHASLVPLDAADPFTPEDHGQLSLLGGFRAECQGVCGV
jgi:hypothetical protein